MEQSDFHCITAVARWGTFTKAATFLKVHASTISRAIGRIEDELGVTLFERSHFGVRLTIGGKTVLTHVQRTLAELDALAQVGRRTGSGEIGEVRLGVRMPPVGNPMRTLLAEWKDRHPDVVLTIWEMNERDIHAALNERRLDAAIMTSHTLWPGATTELLYRERIVVALPRSHALTKYPSLDWRLLRNEIFLVQGWEESQTAREFYASFLGSGVEFSAHAASKQSILALVGAGFGVTLVVASQAEVTFPGVVYRPISDINAYVQLELAWLPGAEDAVVGRFLSYMRDRSEYGRASKCPPT